MDCGLDYGLRFGMDLWTDHEFRTALSHKRVKDDINCAKAGLWTWIMLVDLTEKSIMML